MMVKELEMGKPKMEAKTGTDATKMMDEAMMVKELEMMVKNLSDDQLDELEKLLGKNIEEEGTEFDKIMVELKEMGMEDEDIADMKHLSQGMYDFLSLVPDLGEKLDFATEYDLMDNIHLYLLGLENKLGPLGYIALHHVLEDGEQDGQIVDVIIEPISTKAAPVAANVSPVKTKAPMVEKAMEVKTTAGPTFRRKRSSTVQVLRKRRFIDLDILDD